MEPLPLSRRRLVAGLAIAAAGALTGASSLGAAPPPKEGGLSSEGLLAGRPGFQPRTVAPLVHDEIPGFLSRTLLTAHHAEYARAVERLVATEQMLTSAERSPADAASYGELRRTQVAAANDVLLHEFYFRNLAPHTVVLPRYLEPHMREHMGSLESWTNDFTACALVARRWAVLVYDPYDDRWHNAVMDGDENGAWVGANPLVVCDVAAHAYGDEYPRREEYVTKFLDHLDWEEVARRYRSVDRM
jgi:Fe-Mn family superoxide dismutase